MVYTAVGELMVDSIVKAFEWPLIREVLYAVHKWRILINRHKHIGKTTEFISRQTLGP